MSEMGSAENIYGNKGTDATEKAYRKYFGDSSAAIPKSRYFHRYFQGYTEVRTENPNGKHKNYKSEMFYTAPYKQVDISDMGCLYYKLSFLALTAAAFLSYISALSDTAVEANSSILVAIPGFPTVVPMILLAFSSLFYCFRKRNMTIYEQASSSNRLRYSALIGGIGNLLTAVMSIVYLIVYGSGAVGRAWRSIGMLVLAALLCGTIWYLEKHMQYTDVENHVKLPEGEYHELW